MSMVTFIGLHSFFYNTGHWDFCHGAQGHLVAEAGRLAFGGVFGRTKPIRHLFSSFAVGDNPKRSPRCCLRAARQMLVCMAGWVVFARGLSADQSQFQIKYHFHRPTCHSVRVRSGNGEFLEEAIMASAGPSGAVDAMMASSKNSPL